VACADNLVLVFMMHSQAASRMQLLKLGIVAPLSDILTGNDLPAAVSAAGALLNIVGPDMNSDTERQLLRQCLSDGLVLGALECCMR
jgi:hypothetical protein